jgi:hypothetical protein
VFGAWVCTADGAGSFQRRLTMQPNPKTGFVTLPEVVTGELAGKFGEISLFNCRCFRPATYYGEYPK